MGGGEYSENQANVSLFANWCLMLLSGIFTD